MGKWIGRNLTPVLALAAASLYFFGELTIEVRNRFLHITSLTSRSGYADFALVGFHPLFTYFIPLVPVIPLLYIVLFSLSRIGLGKSHPGSQRAVPDARSSSGIPKIKHGKVSWASLWELVKRNKLRSVRVFVVFVVVPLLAILQG